MSENVYILLCTRKCCVFDGCILEVTWAKPPETQKQKSPTDKRGSISAPNRQLNYDALDHSFDLGLTPNSSSLSSLPIVSSTSARSRLPLHGIPNFKNTFTITRPIQLLNYICLENGWGEPSFHVSCVESDPSQLFFVCSVLIPGFPPLARRFMSDRVCPSPDEAKYYAACYVLKKLDITDVDEPPVFSPPSSASNTLNNFSKNFNGVNSNLNSIKPDFCTPQKNAPIHSYKNQPQGTSYFPERGQGDASYLCNTLTSDGNTFDTTENCPPLFNPNTPIEPNSILGLLASMAVASNVDLPLFNKPKL